MRLPDGSVLMHAGKPYDPVKAHEYYIRNRKLHPRQRGSGQPNNPRGSNSPAGPLASVQRKITPEEHAKQLAYAHQRVAAIKAKLSKLTHELHVKLAEAKQRERDAKKPKTAAEKKKDSLRSKAYRQKHKQQLSNKQRQQRSKAGSSKGGSGSGKSSGPTPITSLSVDQLKARISVTRDDLRAAVDKERNLSAAKQSG